MTEEKRFSQIVASFSSSEEIVLASVEREHIDAYKTGTLKYSWEESEEE